MWIRVYRVNHWSKTKFFHQVSVLIFHMYSALVACTKAEGGEIANNLSIFRPTRANNAQKWKEQTSGFDQSYA